MNSREQLALLKQQVDIVPFAKRLEQTGLRPLRAAAIDILQLNITRRCNMRCKHCHVNAGPHRSEMMLEDVMKKCLDIARRYDVSTIDITGGAPEMHPQLEWFLIAATQLKKRVILRSNLVVLLDDAFRHFIDTYAQLGIEVVGSLPDYRKQRAEKQRGSASFERSIEVLQRLNAKGYGKPGTGLLLNLVHNPAGAFLPGPQQSLEQEYKRRLADRFDVHFNNLFCLTNCPIGRYLEYLVRSDNLDDYMLDLVRAYNPSAALNLMCRTTLSVGWDGRLYDCDFNQMLKLAINHGAPDHIKNFDYSVLAHREIVVANHCYCCTAGAGSSCQGALDTSH